MSDLKCDYCGGENHSVLEEHNGKYYHPKCSRIVQEKRQVGEHFERVRCPFPIMSPQHWKAYTALGYGGQSDSDL